MALEQAMECGVATETEIHFNESGIKLSPNDLTYKSNKRNFDYARAEISIDAANVLSDGAKFPEGVYIYVAGRKLAGLYIPENGIRIDSDSAQVEFYDPRKILDRGIIDKTFQKATLRGMVDWFEGKVEKHDPYNVIEDVQLIQKGRCNPVKITEDFHKFAGWSKDIDNAIQEADEAIAPNRNPYGNAVENFEVAVRRWVDGLDGNKEEGGFDFNQITLAECLGRIEDEFQVSSYIDQNNILRIGEVDRDVNFFVAGNKKGVWTVSDYNITVDPNKVSQVYVKGGYKHSISYGEDGRQRREVPERKKLQTWGYATTNQQATYTNATKDIKGEAIAIEASDVRDGMQLEARAARRLEQAIAGEVSGNVTINCISSSPDEFGYPHEIKPLDTFGVLPPRHDCNINVPATSFRVESVKHEVKPDSWKLQLDVSQIPQSKFYTASFKTEPTSAEFMSSERFYEETGEYYNNGQFQEDNVHD